MRVSTVQKSWGEGSGSVDVNAGIVAAIRNECASAQYIQAVSVGVSGCAGVFAVFKNTRQHCTNKVRSCRPVSKRVCSSESVVCRRICCL